uniref:Uncharacterized protein n=1 Tax=Anguilla anguilla TaxID=7936 RepID=A0A0E9UR41_ANGAN
MNGKNKSKICKKSFEIVFPQIYTHNINSLEH